jgi:phospholipid/cholesterol/gamma-HCH transport system substrate-binding protein
MTGIRVVALKFAAFATVSIVLLVLLVNTMHNGVSGSTTHYRALFSDVSGLRVGDDVKVAGVRVGRVDAIEVHGEDAEVRFELRADQPILDNTRLVMRYQNLVGQRYVAMVQPAEHGGRLHPDAVIPARLTDPGFDLTALLNGFRPLFEVLQPGDVNRLATSLVQVLQGEGGTVESLLRQTTRLTTFVADRDQVIGQVLTNLTPVLQNLSGHDRELSRTVVALKQLMTGLAQDRRSIGESIDGVSELIESTSALLRDSREPLVGSVRQLRTVGEMLAATRARLVDAIDAYRTAFGALGRATSYQNAVNVFICTLRVQLGPAPSLNTAGSHPKRSEVCR